MNQKRRSRLKTALMYLEKASEIISEALDKEQDCIDNVPENLQDTERYESMEAAVDCLEDALSSIDDARESVSSASA